METLHLYYLGLAILFACAPIVFFILLFISAPYGRHGRGGWGPEIGARAAWLLQETPAVIVFAYVYFQGSLSLDIVPLLLFFVWQAHYVQRTYVFPFLMRLEGKKTPLSIVALAFTFTAVNGATNALAISHSSISAHLQTAWLWDPRFIAGVALFVIGYIINRHSDAVLRNLRKPGETGYKIPKGGLYRWVTSPNYLGELIEWLGWALATWSLAGLAFFVFTAANLIPRARTHHKWYLKEFPDYPKSRRVIFPWLY